MEELRRQLKHVESKIEEYYNKVLRTKEDIELTISHNVICKGYLLNGPPGRYRQLIESNKIKLSNLREWLLRYEEKFSEYRQKKESILEKLKPLELEYDHRLHNLQVASKMEKKGNQKGVTLHLFMVKIWNHEIDVFDLIMSFTKVNYRPRKARDFRVALDKYYSTVGKCVYVSPDKWVIDYCILEYAWKYTVKMIEKSDRYIKIMKINAGRYRIYHGILIYYGVLNMSRKEYEDRASGFDDYIENVHRPLKALYKKLKKMKDNVI